MRFLIFICFFPCLVWAQEDQFNNWKKDFPTEHIYLVYAGPFLSNPASIMGHIFLKFSAEGQASPTQSFLGFVALADPDLNPINYMYSGLAGLFNGRFIEGLYFEKTQEYSNLELRDIWEFELNLSVSQKDKLLRLIWEQKQIPFTPYYFLSNNCATVFRDLLPQAISENKLSENAFYKNTPLDVIKWLYQNNLIKKETLRPSIRSVLINRYKNELNIDDKKLSLEILKNKKIQKKAGQIVNEVVIDAIYLKKYRLKYEKIKKNGFATYFKEDDDWVKEYGEFEHDILIERSLQGPSEETNKIIKNYDGSLKHVHPLRQIEFKYQAPPQNQNILRNPNLLSLKGSLIEHHLLDSTQGFLPNTSLTILQGQISHDILKFKFLEIESYPDYLLIDPLYSWKAGFSFTNNRLKSEKSFNLNLGVGLSKSLTTHLFSNFLIETQHYLMTSNLNLQTDLYLSSLFIYEFNDELKSLLKLQKKMTSIPTGQGLLTSYLIRYNWGEEYQWHTEVSHSRDLNLKSFNEQESFWEISLGRKF